MFRITLIFFFEVQNFAISETKGRIKNLMAPNDFSGAKPILLLFLANFNFRAVALIVWLLQVFEIFQNTLFFSKFKFFFTPMLQQCCNDTAMQQARMVVRVPTDLGAYHTNT